MKPTKRLENKIEKCPKVWLIVQLEHWYIKECYWTGKWTKDDKPQPIVWHYNKDFEKWLKVPIFDTTAGWTIAYSFFQGIAEEIAEAMEERVKLSIEKSTMGPRDDLE